MVKPQLDVNSVFFHRTVQHTFFNFFYTFHYFFNYYFFLTKNSIQLISEIFLGSHEYISRAFIPGILQTWSFKIHLILWALIAFKKLLLYLLGYDNQSQFLLPAIKNYAWYGNWSQECISGKDSGKYEELRNDYLMWLSRMQGSPTQYPEYNSNSSWHSVLNELVKRTCAHLASTAHGGEDRVLDSHSHRGTERTWETQDPCGEKYNNEHESTCKWFKVKQISKNFW